ncbi:hypothetical protein [Ruegeria atlantica]|uniref:hypothetical protein n=1 Tax=Ruegeria atlantica TaxID=81569 RepID=UPI00147FFDC4|nr:hypothetical protein [Ruegeria atlantica]
MITTTAPRPPVAEYPTLIVSPDYDLRTGQPSEDAVWLGVQGAHRVGRLFRGDCDSLAESVLHQITAFGLPDQTVIVWQNLFSTTRETLGVIRQRSAEVLDERAKAHALKLYTPNHRKHPAHAGRSRPPKSARLKG